MLKPKNNASVIVIGGGLAGLALSSLLGSHNITVICLDRDIPDTHLTEAYDGRTTAISYGSRNVLTHCGIWDEIDPRACPIEDIRILDGKSPVLMQFLSHDMDGKSFGWIVENRDLRKKFYDRLNTLPSARHMTGVAVKDIDVDSSGVSVTLENGKIWRADLLVGADGRQSITRRALGIETRQWIYKQKAHVCVVHHENPHKNAAYEHFREEGPFAILPMIDDDEGRHRSAVVWSDHNAKKRTHKMSDESFLAGLRTRFPAHYGDIELGPYRAEYPLGFLHAESYTGTRTALVAEAAHVMHPIAGQGLNMSLRDVATLSECVIDAQAQDKEIASPSLLKTYERKRRMDNAMMLAATDGLNRLYANSLPPVRLARNLGVRTIAAIPPAKKFFMSQAMGLNGRLSRFVRESA